MKKSLLSFFVFIALGILSCKKGNTGSNAVDPNLPTVTTSAITYIGTTDASGGGNINSEGSSSVNARGVCWSTSNNPTISNSKTTDGAGFGLFTSSLTGLTANTTYYMRAYATNSAGTAYGNEQNFNTNTNSGNTVTDIDGNVYNTVTIGTQVWMKENLKTTRYNDGTAIPTGLSNTAWVDTRRGAYAIYNNNAANNTTYGKLYNWYAVSTGKLAPAGWHVSTDAEWITLSRYLGDNQVGGKLKATSLWISPNLGATNSSGFTGLPAGYRNFDGGYSNIMTDCNFWTSTVGDPRTSISNGLIYYSSFVFRNFNYLGNGFSIRCVKD